jgi:uncharacterized protein
MAVQMDKFAPEVIERLKWYVYRLVDPRSGETFYVGKGKGNRVFQHAKGALSASDDEDATDLKSQRIKDIGAVGLEVAHVIHRHGIESEDVAFQIEGAVLDAYPGLTNQVGGHGSGDYGVRHAVEIVAEYTAEPFEAREPLILISIGKTYDDKDRSIYEAVRGCWVINPERARKHKLVLAHRRGIVVGVFRPTEWLPSTTANFRWHIGNENRWGFVGDPADEETARIYMRKRVPEAYRAKGAANPVRFINPPPATG